MSKLKKYRYNINKRRRIIRRLLRYVEIFRIRRDFLRKKIVLFKKS